MNSDEDLRKQARIIATRKTEFYLHFFIYISVNAFLILQWLVISGPNSFPWFVFVLFGWGIGIVVHAFDTYRGKDYIERQTEKEYQKLKGNT